MPGITFLHSIFLSRDLSILRLIGKKSGEEALKGLIYRAENTREAKLAARERRGQERGDQLRINRRDGKAEETRPVLQR